jgi:hypothetical protein
MSEKSGVNSRECTPSRLKAIVLLVREGKLSFHACKGLQRELGLFRYPKKVENR